MTEHRTEVEVSMVEVILVAKPYVKRSTQYEKRMSRTNIATKGLCIIFIASLTFVSSGAMAAVSLGSYDCGEWIQNKGGSRAWLLGYLSGINRIIIEDVGKPGSDPLRKLGSVEQVIEWMNNYCRANPLKSVSSGAGDLYLEIIKK